MMQRREFLRRAGLGAVTLGFPRVGKSAVTGFQGLEKKPNVIIILADDLGWGDLSCQPHDPKEPDAPVDTPHIDRLAAEGTRCTQAYATCMVCTPSRVGLLTGRYQQRIGFYEFKEAMIGIPRSVPLMPECLKPRGYATACIGKWHVGYAPERQPLQRGFDRFFGFLGGQHDYFDAGLGDPSVGFPFAHGVWILDQEKPVKQIQYLTDEFTVRAIEFIEQQAAAKQPFFMYLAYSAPHPSMQATWEKLKPYADKRGGKFNSRDIARAMINSLDEDVGQIMERLRTLGIADNTLIFFTSDNGGADDRGEGQPVCQHNGGLRPRKGFFWEGGVRIPFIVRWPGRVPAALVYDQPVSQLDIFATVAAATGTVAPPQLDGVDLFPFLRGEKSGMPHEVLHWGFEKEVNRFAIRKSRWKLTRDVVSPRSQYDQSNRIVTELHDLDTDREERVDVAAQHPEIVQELLALHEEFCRDLPPTILVPEARVAWLRGLEEWKKKEPNANSLRRDGAPGHWMR